MPLGFKNSNVTLSVGRLVHHLTPDRNVPTTTTFVKTFMFPRKINPTDFSYRTSKSKYSLLQVALAKLNKYDVQTFMVPLCVLLIRKFQHASTLN